MAFNTFTPNRVKYAFASAVSTLALLAPGQATAQTAEAIYPAGTSLMKGGTTNEVTRKPVNCRSLHRDSRGSHHPTQRFWREADIEGASIGQDVDLSGDERLVKNALGRNTHAWFQHYSEAHLINGKWMCRSQFLELDYRAKIAALTEKHGEASRIPSAEMPQRPAATEISACPPLEVYQACVRLLRAEEPK